MRNGWQIQEDDMIEEQLENHLHEGEEEHMHTHVLEDGTIIFDIQTSQIKQRCSFTEI